MPAPAIEIASAIVTRKGGRMPRLAIARPKPPFVVSSISTKRYAPAVKQMAPVQKLPQVPLPISSKERLSIPRQAPTVQASRPGTLPTVVTREEPPRPPSKPMSMPAPEVTTKVQRSFAHKPSNIVRSSKERLLTDRSGATVTHASTQVTTNPLTRRPSCVPYTRTHRPTVGVSGVVKGTEGVMVKVFTTGPCNMEVACQKPSVTVDTSKTAEDVRTTDGPIKKAVVTGGNHVGMPTRNRRLTPPKPIVDVHPQPIQPTSCIAFSTPTSPNLYSFPSPSWTIVVDVNFKHPMTPTAICSDENSGMPKRGSKGWYKDSYSPSESVSSSPTLASSPNPFQTLESPADAMIGSNGNLKMCSSPTVGLPTEVSHTVCAATIISPTKNSAVSPIAALAKVLQSSQASSTAGDPEAGNRTRTTVQGAIDVARSLFSASRRVSRLSTETASDKTIGSNVSRIRKLFIPPLDRDSKASKNPSTQMEIEMLRAQKKVVNGGMNDHRLDRLGSLTAMAIVAKRLEASSSDSPNPSQV